VPGEARELAPAAVSVAAAPAIPSYDVAPLPTPVAGHAASLLAGTPLDPRTPLPGTSAAEVADDLASSPASLVEAAATPSAPAAPVAVESTWPCPRCGERVALSVDVCGSCGAGFLAGVSTKVSAHVPLIGDMTQLSSGQRWLVAMGFSVALIVVFVLLAFIVGEVF
jgi:hypothetical protein